MLRLGRTPRRTLAYLALAAIAVGAAAVLSIATTRGGAADASAAQVRDNDLLASVLRGMNTNLVSVTVGPPPSDYASSDSAWLYATHTAGQPPAQNAEDAWYAYLIAGAYGARCTAEGADCLDGYTFAGSDGMAKDDSSGRLVMDEFPPSSTSRDDLSTAIEQRLEAEGLTASSLTFEHPYGWAPIVEIQSSDPQAAVDKFNAGTVFGGLGLDGYLVRVLDANGSVAFVADSADRAQSGQGWFGDGVIPRNLPTGPPPPPQG